MLKKPAIQAACSVDHKAPPQQDETVHID